MGLFGCSTCPKKDDVISSLQSDVRAIQSRLNGRIDEIGSLKARILSYDNELSQKSTEITGLKGTISVERKEKAQLNATISQLKLDILGHQREVSDRKTEIANLTLKIEKEKAEFYATIQKQITLVSKGQGESSKLQAQLLELSNERANDKNTIKSLEVDKQTLDMAKKNHISQIMALENQLNDLEDQNLKLSEENKAHKDSIEQLQREKAADKELISNLQNLKLTVEEEKTRGEKEMNDRLAQKNEELNDTQQELNETQRELDEKKNRLHIIEEQKKDVEVKDVGSPWISIGMESLLSLNDIEKGWVIKASHDPKIFTEKAMISIAVLGMYDVGKSWFCNQFTGSQDHSSGYSQTTSSINFIFQDAEDHFVGMIDTPGSSEAIRVTDKDLLDMIQAGTEDGGKKFEYEKDRYFWQYKQLKNDAKIIQDLKERFIGEIADVLIVICNKLSEKEQEMLYKVIKNFQEVKEQRFKEAKDAYKQGRDTILYVIHNYKNMIQRKQVERQIEKDLFKSFTVQEVKMFTGGDPGMKENRNQKMYRDQFGINHLLLAAVNSDAGDYYNEPTFNFLKQKVKTLENRSHIDVPKTFFAFCQNNLPPILKRSSDDLLLEINYDKRSIFRNSKSKPIALENIQYDEFGNYQFSSMFEPAYTVLQKELDDGVKQVIVEVEFVDSDILPAKPDTNDAGRSYLVVSGEKKMNRPTDAKVIDDTRKKGRFSVKIPLPIRGRPTQMKREPEKGKTDMGIVRYVLTYGSLPDIEC